MKSNDLVLFHSGPHMLVRLKCAVSHCVACVVLCRISWNVQFLIALCV